MRAAVAESWSWGEAAEWPDPEALQNPLSVYRSHHPQYGLGQMAPESVRRVRAGRGGL